MNNNYIEVLRRNPAYLRLWIAQAVSLLGDWFTTIALATLVAVYSHGSGLAVSGLLIARFSPPLIVGPMAGVLVDRLNRKRLLIFSDVLRTFIALGFLLANSPERLWLIYVLTVLQFSLSALFEPCRSALMPSLVRTEDLVQANTLGSVTWSVMLAVGAVIGGGVTAVFGTSTALVIDSSTFAISALLIASIKVPARQMPVRQEHTKDETGFLDGLRYIAAHPATAAALMIKLGGSIGSVDLLMVFYATQLFVIGQNGTGSLGLLWSAFGVGAVLGPLLVNRLNDNSVKRMRRLIVIGYAFLAVGWFLFGIAPTLLLAAIAIAVKAMGSSVYWTYSSVILQKTVPDHYLGRVFSLDLVGFQLATVISALATGWLIDQASRASGIDLHTALRLLSASRSAFQAQEPAVRAIVFGTGIASLVPLVLWTLALPWMERQATPSAWPDDAAETKVNMIEPSIETSAEVGRR